MFEHITEHDVQRIVQSDSRHTRELIRELIFNLEGKIEKMAINTKDVLAKLQSQSTQIDGIITLCDTLHTHLHEVIQKLNSQGVNTADLQAMSDLLDQQSSRIASAITTDADESETPVSPPAPSGGPENTPTSGEGDNVPPAA